MQFNLYTVLKDKKLAGKLVGSNEKRFFIIVTCNIVFSFQEISKRQLAKVAVMQCLTGNQIQMSQQEIQTRKGIFLQQSIRLAWSYVLYVLMGSP